jgi:hypothetical protein
MLVGLNVNKDAAAGGSNRRAIGDIVSVHLGPGRQLQVDVRTMHEVQSEDSLLEKAVPQVEWEVWVGAA